MLRVGVRKPLAPLLRQPFDTHTASKGSVLVSEGCRAREPQTPCLEQLRWTACQFWEREVQGQGVAALVPSGGRGGAVPGLPRSFLWTAGGLWVPWLADASACCLPLCSLGLLPVCVCLQISPFYKDTSHMGLKSTLLQYDLTFTNHISSCPISK